MESFITVTGQAAPMLAANIDTDVIMPKKFLKGICRQGLDRGLFHDIRFTSDGAPNPEFILNQPGWQQSRFLVTGPNFGCGSSREHAVWGLQQLGIRALIGTSFAGIFYDNCQRNGILTITLAPEVHKLLADTVSCAEENTITVDLASQKIGLSGGASLSFQVDELRRSALMKGLDAIGSTLEKQSLIEAFQKRHLDANPWLA